MQIFNVLLKTLESFFFSLAALHVTSYHIFFHQDAITISHNNNLVDIKLNDNKVTYCCFL